MFILLIFLHDLFVHSCYWLSLVWGCQMRFVKIMAILSTVPDPDLSFVVILSCTGKKETMSIVKPQFSLILAGSFTFRCVCVT